MPHHPSLSEVIKNQSNYEWLETDICGFFLGDFVDSENEKGGISSPSFHLFSNSSESEYSTFSFNKATINIELAEENDLQNLKGEKPLGSFNYYDTERSFITIRVSNLLYNNLLSLITHNIENFSLKLAIPVWEDNEVKCLPLLKYKLTYKSE